MAVQFIIGRAGSGKSALIKKQIVDALRANPLGGPFGPVIYWIVPQQLTFETERDLAVELGVFSRCRVFSFEQLGVSVLEEVGGLNRPAISSQGRRLIIGHLLRAHASSLRYFGKSAQHPGLAEQISQTLADFELHGNSAGESLDAAMNSSQPTNGEENALHAKLHDLRLIQTHYEQVLGQDRLDPHRRLQQILLSVGQSKQLADATIYIDSFFDFTRFEREMIVALSRKCKSVQVSMLMDPDSPVIEKPDLLPDDMSVFHRVESAYRLLAIALRNAGVKPATPVLLRRVVRFEAATSLGRIERSLFSDESMAGKSTLAASATDLVRIACPDRAGEIEAVARAFLDELRTGRRMRDLAVVVRDLDKYLPIIERIFTENHLRFFIDQRKPSSHHPLITFIQSLLRIARDGWNTSDVLKLLRTGLTDLKLDESDELENYCIDHRIDGAAWADKDPWQYQRILERGSEDEETPADIAYLQHIQSLRSRLVGPIVDVVAAIGKAPLRVGQLTKLLRDAMTSCQLSNRIANWISRARGKGDVQQAGEHEQVWAELNDLLDQFDQLLGQEIMPLDIFIEVLDSALVEFDLALPPPAIDQIIIGELDRTRLANVHTVAVVGLCEGQFPRVGKDTGVLSDSDRGWLDLKQVKVGSDTTRRLLDEQFLAYFALSRAKQKLIVTRPTADDRGRLLNPSIFWDRLSKLLPDSVLLEPGRAGDRSVAQIISAGELVSSILSWARAGADEKDSTHAQLYNWLARQGAKGTAPGANNIAALRDRVWGSLSYSNEAKLSADKAARLFVSPLQSTSHRIETFAACPFKHFASYGLNLAGREESQVSRLDLSRLYHGVMGRLMDDAIKDSKQIDLEAQAKNLPRQTAEMGEKLREQILLSSERGKFLLRRAEDTLAKVLKSHDAAIKRSEMHPAQSRVRFGPGGNIPAVTIKTPKGRTIELSGTIDRIDIRPGGNEAAVFDLSSSVGPMNLTEGYFGLAIKLLVMLLSVKEHGKKLSGKDLEPVAALVAAFNRKLEDVDDPAKEIGPNDSEFHLAPKMRGIVVKDAIRLLDNKLEPSKQSSVIAAYVKKDGEIGHADSSDVVESAEFDALLAHTRKTIAECADEIIDGKIDIHPYKIGTTSACVRCDYCSVCRFEPVVNRYHVIEAMKRTQVLAKVMEENK